MRKKKNDGLWINLLSDQSPDVFTLHETASLSREIKPVSRFRPS